MRSIGKGRKEMDVICPRALQQLRRPPSPTAPSAAPLRGHVARGCGSPTLPPPVRRPGWARGSRYRPFCSGPGGRGGAREKGRYPPQRRSPACWRRGAREALGRGCTSGGARRRRGELGRPRPAAGTWRGARSAPPPPPGYPQHSASGTRLQCIGGDGHGAARVPR